MSENEATLVDEREFKPESQQALAPVEKGQSILIPDEHCVDAFQAYQRLQTQLDAVLKDCTVKIKGKLYRKKSYWRAVAMAFKLNVDLLQETQITSPANEKDWGWIATYCARANNGQYAVGDGACFASEKRGNDTVHNVRSNAHTRAYNRAVSNLVGFGEVSAEEFNRETASPMPMAQNVPNGAASNPNGITRPQMATIQATTRALASKTNRDPKEYLQGIYNELELVGVHSTKDLTKEEASRVIEKLNEIRGEE